MPFDELVPYVFHFCYLSDTCIGSLSQGMHGVDHVMRHIWQSAKIRMSKMTACGTAFTAIPAGWRESTLVLWQSLSVAGDEEDGDRRASCQALRDAVQKHALESSLAVCTWQHRARRPVHVYDMNDAQRGGTIPGAFNCMFQPSLPPCWAWVSKPLSWQWRHSTRFSSRAKTMAMNMVDYVFV